MFKITNQSIFDVLEKVKINEKVKIKVKESKKLCTICYTKSTVRI